MALGDQHNEAMTFLRNTIAQAPRFGDRWEVVNIETFAAGPQLMVLDLDDGTTISLTVVRERRDEHDEESLRANLAGKAAQAKLA